MIFNNKKANTDLNWFFVIIIFLISIPLIFGFIGSYFGEDINLNNQINEDLQTIGFVEVDIYRRQFGTNPLIANLSTQFFIPDGYTTSSNNTIFYLDNDHLAIGNDLAEYEAFNLDLRMYNTNNSLLQEDSFNVYSGTTFLSSGIILSGNDNIASIRINDNEGINLYFNEWYSLGRDLNLFYSTLQSETNPVRQLFGNIITGINILPIWLNTLIFGTLTTMIGFLIARWFRGN